MSYSSDVFFKPWVGLDYPYGWTLDANDCLVRGDEKNNGFKVMILGLEHYCIGNHPEYENKQEEILFNSTNYYNTVHKSLRCCDGNCAHLFACKDMTSGVVKDHIFAKDDNAAQSLGIYWKGNRSNDSQKNFEQIFNAQQNELSTAQRKVFWNSVLLSNFFQCGMPNTSGNIYTDEEKSRAVNAFKNIIEIHKPDIVFIWGKIPLDIEEKEKTDITIKHNTKTGKTFNNIHTEILSTIKDHNVLLVFIPHPSNKYFGKRYDSNMVNNFNNHILTAFQKACKLRKSGLL